jgi:HK97 family phage major capsid protein/HK97 family phage prohead protease
MKQPMKLPALRRDLTADIEVRSGDRITFPFASDAPVERGWGREILDMRGMDTSRFTAGAVPLLFNHNWDNVVGMSEKAWVGADNRAYVQARWFDHPDAQKVRSMVEAGLRNVSFGYRVTEYEDAGNGDYIARSFEPHEVSIVSVPADASVGVGRSEDNEHLEVRILRAGSEMAESTAAHEDEHMTEKDSSAATSADMIREVDPTAEKLRQRALENLGDQYGIHGDVIRRWKDEDISVGEATRQTLKIIAERTKADNAVTAVGLSPREQRQYSLIRAINGVVHKDWKHAGLELEAHQEIQKRTGKILSENSFFVPLEVQKRDLAVGSSGGGYLVATDTGGFIELLRNRSVALQMGATRLSGLQGNVALPKQTAAATAYWLAGETSSITESQPTISQLTLGPKTVGAYTEISRQLTLQSSPDAESLVMSDLARVVALAADVAALRGSGSGGEPQGIVGTTGIGSVSGTSLGYAGALEFQTDVAAANVMPARGGYVTTPAVAALMMAEQRFSSTDTPLWVGNIWDGQMVGFRAMASNQMSSATMLFGAWEDLIWAEWGILEVEVNPYASFAAGIIGVRAMYTMDIGVRYAGSFSYASSIS